MSLGFLQIDVFADRAYAGNPLAVFYDAPGLTTEQMQAIAREMNLSETTFVTESTEDAYTMRIFTPASELPFAGHPTIGTTWVLKHLGRVTAERCVQTTEAGDTPVEDRDGILWFERTGTADAPGDDGDLVARLAEALTIPADSIGLDGSALGGAGALTPAFSDAGVRQLMVPLADVGVLERCAPRPDLLAEVGAGGAYCFSALDATHVRSRGFFPGFGVPEDPATGSAAAALGIYLGSRVGDVELEVAQGVEMGRPSRIYLRGRAEGAAEIGGRSELVFTGTLERLPEP